MARLEVTSASYQDGRIQSLEIQLQRLPKRTLDRDAVLNLMKDGHSFLTAVDNETWQALQLVEVDDEFYIRADNMPKASDSLPENLLSN